jgi:hypothetical protein
MISDSLLQNALSYKQYRQLLEDLMSQGKTTGNDQSEAMLHYAKINLQRSQRIDKTLVLNEATKQTVSKITKPYTWLVITEGWCGDSAQNISLFAKMGEINPLISFKILLRDEHLDLMDQYLTNGGRAIPKLICLDENKKELFTWGPRPKIAQDLVDNAKKLGISKADWNLSLHSLYAQDKLQSLQNEFIELITKFMI